MSAFRRSRLVILLVAAAPQLGLIYAASEWTFVGLSDALGAVPYTLGFVVVAVLLAALVAYVIAGDGVSAVTGALISGLLLAPLYLWIVGAVASCDPADRVTGNCPY